MYVRHMSSSSVWEGEFLKEGHMSGSTDKRFCFQSKLRVKCVCVRFIQIKL